LKSGESRSIRRLPCFIFVTFSVYISWSSVVLLGRSGYRIPVRKRKFFSSPKRPDRRWVPPCLQFNGCRCSFAGVKRPGREIFSRRYGGPSVRLIIVGLVPRLRTSGAMLPGPQCVFMVWTGTALPLPLRVNTRFMVLLSFRQ